MASKQVSCTPVNHYLLCCFKSKSMQQSICFQLLILVAALCTVMCRPAEMDESPMKQPMTSGTSQKGSLSDPEIDEVGMKNRLYQYPLGPPQGFIPVYFMMPPPPNAGGGKQRMRRPYYQKERDQTIPPLENPDPSSDLEQKMSEERTSIDNPEPSTVEFPAGDSVESSRPMEQDQPERSAKDLEQLKTFSSLVQPPRAIPRTKRTPQRVRGYLDLDDYGRGYGGYGGYGDYYGGYGGGYHGYNPYRGWYDDEVIDIDIQI